MRNLRGGLGAVQRKGLAGSADSDGKYGLPLNSALRMLAMYRNSLLILFMSCAIVSAAYGNNNLFLPGDAFFPTELTAAKLNELQKTGGELELSYSSFGGYEGAFCGYAGYSRAKIPAVDRAFVGNLINVYAE